MFENPRRGRQARNFTADVPKILDLGYKDFIIIHRVSASNVSRRKMRFLVSYLEYQKRFFCFILFILLYFVLLALLT